MSQPPPLLRLRDITKRFGAVVANSGVDFDLRAGEIHALVGENGAGKTTLMRVLFGMITPDSGTIELNGEQVRLTSARDAIARGIGMVHQHFTLVPEFTVAQNVTLGAEQSRLGLVDFAASALALEEPMRLLGMRTDVNAVVATLSVAQQQRVEILKVLYRQARIMVLDEPTAVLTPQETADLFATLRGLADRGYAIVFISHKLREVMEIADRVTVLRGGSSAGTFDVAAADIPTLVEAMTGRSDVNLGRVVTAAPSDQVALAVSGLSGRSGTDAALADASFTIRAGEILGLAGVDGNGQHSLVGLLTGLVKPQSGSIALHGDELVGLDVAARRRAGLAYVPEDRQAAGLPLAGSVLEALAADKLARATGWLGLGRAFTPALRSWGAHVVEAFDIRTSSLGTRCATLSGGNQQKIVVARELGSHPRFVVMAQPTRGVDLGATDRIYSAIADLASSGAAVLVVSADLDELLRLSHRILVVYRGSIVADLPAATATREKLGMHMLGAADVGAA